VIKTLPIENELAFTFEAVDLSNIQFGSAIVDGRDQYEVSIQKDKVVVMMNAVNRTQGVHQIEVVLKDRQGVLYRRSESIQFTQ
jgi:hypothetical protein